MVIRTLSIGLLTIAAAASPAAASRTDRLHLERMAVLKVDHATGWLQGAGDRRWPPVVGETLDVIHTGAIVKPERVAGAPTPLVRLRPVADALTSPE